MKTFMLMILSIFMSSTFAAEKIIPVAVTTKGFEPAKIDLKDGDTVTLAVTRKTDATCATEIKVPSLKLKKELPLNKTVNVSLGKVKKGDITFSCGMDMVSGVVNVK